MSKVRGRIVQIVDIMGKRFSPIDVEGVLGTVPELGYDYQIIRDKPSPNRPKLKLECQPHAQDVRSLSGRVEEALYHQLGVESEVELVPMGGISRVLFKAERFITTYKQS